MNLSIPAVQAGVEYRVYKNLYVGHEFGLMWHDNPNFYLWRSGYRHKTQVRLYHDIFNPGGTNRFFGLEFRRWWFRAVDEGFFCRQDCLFTQTIQYEIEQSAFGIGFNYGRRFYIFNDRLFLELSGSTGRLYKTNKTDLPNDVGLAGFRTQFFNLFDRADRWTNYKRDKIYFHLHFRIGFDIK